MAWLLVGCTSEPTPTTAFPQASPPEPVTVIRTALTSVLTVNGVVAANPQFAGVAPVTGVVVQKIREGKAVRAGGTIGTVNGRPVKAVGGGVVDHWLVATGVKVNAGSPIVAVRYEGFGIMVEVPPAHAYRMYDGPDSARAQILGGPGPVKCHPAQPISVAEGVASPAEGGVALPVLCLLEDAPVIAGLSAIVGLRTAEAEDVLALPVTAVAGQAGSGTVAKLVDGQPVITEVKLGITDGLLIEIVSGLAEGDQVLANGPGLSPEIR